MFLGEKKYKYAQIIYADGTNRGRHRHRAGFRPNRSWRPLHYVYSHPKPCLYKKKKLFYNKSENIENNHMQKI